MGIREFFKKHFCRSAAEVELLSNEIYATGVSKLKPQIVGEPLRPQPVIRIWKLGSLEHSIYPTEASINRLANILAGREEQETMDLIWGPELTVEWLPATPGINLICGPKVKLTKRDGRTYVIEYDDGNTPSTPFDIFSHYLVNKGDAADFDITAWDAVPYVVNAQGNPEPYTVVPGETQVVVIPLVLNEKQLEPAAKELLIVAAGCRGEKLVDAESEVVVEFDGWKIAVVDPEHHLISVEQNLACGIAVLNANAVRFLNVKEKVDAIREIVTGS